MSNPPVSPGFVAGQELTAAQLNQAFNTKQDYPAVTMPSNDSSLAVATTAFVHAAIVAGASNTPPAMDSGSTGTAGSLTTYARGDHAHPSDTSRAALSGATFTGAVTLAADPTAALGAVTKQYVDARALSANIVGFGGVGDGVTDCTAAFNAAVAALQASPGGGGTVFFPSGTWYTATGLTIQSKIHIQGAGVSSTTLVSDGHHYNIVTAWPFAGAQYTDAITYPINAPTQGANTVTTTSAANAGNFNPGDVIFISGGLHGTSWWFPSYTTTVASANSSTGVITLTETLPIGGTDVQLVQKALKYVTDVRISDLTVDITPGSPVGGVEINLARNVVLERFASRTHSTTRHSYVALVSIRDLYVANSLFVGGYFDCLGCTNAEVVNNTFQQSVVIFDGGTFNSSFVGNTLTDPQIDGSPNLGIGISSSSQSNRIIGNIINGLAASTAIAMGGGGGSPPLTNPYGNNVVIGNTIYGTTTTNTTAIALGNNSPNNTVIGNNINNVGTGIFMSTNTIGNIVSGNLFNNVTNPVIVDATSGIIPIINDSWNAVPSGTTSPNVAFGSLLQTGNTSATNITGFTGGVTGQEATLWVNDANTTLVYGGNFILQGLTNFSPPAQTMMKFSYRNGVWRELSRSINAVAAVPFFRGILIGPGGGGLTISSIATQAAARKGALAIDTNNLAYYDSGLTSGAPFAFGGTSGTIGATSSSATIAATGTFTLTLPASPLTGAWVYLVSTAAQVVQSASANVIPLGGGAAGTAIFPASAPHWCVLQYNGTNWVTFASDAVQQSIALAAVTALRRDGTVYYTNTGASTAPLGSFALTANTIYLVPLIIARTFTPTVMAFRIQTGGSVPSSFVNLGIYNVGADGGPTSIVLSTGSLSGGVVGTIAGTITSGPLNAGQYLAAIWSTANVTVTAVPAGTMLATFGMNLDATTPLCVAAMSTVSTYSGTTWPDLGTTTPVTMTLIGSNVAVPILGIK